MKKLFISSFLLPVFLTIFISLFIIPVLYDKNYVLKYNENVVAIQEKASYIWPTPGYKTITSYFGYRVSPTSGASTYHGGVDIGAPQGTKILAVASGTVKYVGWNGANGYTVMISHENDAVSTYGHVSDNFLVSVGDVVRQGDVIANVGPKYIAGPANNPYKDSTGKTTNGATTGPHLHFALSISNKKVDPLDYLPK
ncbi:MAG: M23 family metallopeptidase [Clostridia bacterium]|nr:M23 family metallopeptidase [Clostridia bacterium]